MRKSQRFEKRYVDKVKERVKEVRIFDNDNNKGIGKYIVKNRCSKFCEINTQGEEKKNWHFDFRKGKKDRLQRKETENGQR